jgi:5-methylcytosine-specific restriction protein A
MLNFFSSRKLRYAIRSPKWSTIRKEHLKKYPTCTACGSSKNLEVHHIVPVHIDPSKELDIDNLITLCSENCHILFGHLMYFKSWNKNVVNDCANMNQKIITRP